ncbi:MAG: reverse transcriptase/maturase family protein [Gammaproteobacteria bacterium]
MKRTRIEASEIADLHNLARAAHKAAKGKRTRPVVSRFFAGFDNHINRLSADIQAGLLPYGRYSRFVIHDPKTRTIHAACFEDRVFHHALIQSIGPVLERAMVPSAFACRVGKGTHAAIRRVQGGLREYPWYVKIDIAKYFDSIDHDILLKILYRRFKGEWFIAQLQRLVESYSTRSGKGLPIGALTSQYFANYYLDGLDRLITEELGGKSHVRYMDDSIWSGGSKEHAKDSLSRVRDFLDCERALCLKPPVQINRSAHGVTFCGLRVRREAVRLTPRRKRRYRSRRQFWERRYAKGEITALELQQAYSGVHGITVGADSREWRRKNLGMFPAPDS